MCSVGRLSLPSFCRGPRAMQVADERYRAENGGRRTIASEGGVPAADHFHGKWNGKMDSTPGWRTQCSQSHAPIQLPCPLVFAEC
jgi:hypothetical protein